GGDAQRRIEPGVEATAELGEVLARTQLGVSVSRVDDVDLDQRDGHQPLDLAHRGHKTLPPRFAQRLEKRAGQSITASLEQIAFGTPGGCEPHRTDAPVVLVRLDSDEFGALEGAEKAAEIA